MMDREQQAPQAASEEAPASEAACAACAAEAEPRQTGAGSPDVLPRPAQRRPEAYLTEWMRRFTRL